MDSREIARTYLITHPESECCVGLKPGSVVKLIWERSNKFNPRALKITYYGQRVGYIEQGSEVEDLLCNNYNEGNRVTAYITYVNKDNPSLPKYQIGIKNRVNVNVKKEEDDVEY